MSKFDPVLLGIFRRVWPQMIANDIIGVQPMTGATGSIFSMSPRYLEWKFKVIDKLYFKNFLRLNDKRRMFSHEAIIDAKYPLMHLTIDQMDKKDDIWEWCNTTIGKYSWIHNGYDVIAFSDEQYATLFKLTWD